MGIHCPDELERNATTVNLKHGGLASSGDDQRFLMVDGKCYGHILNPKTGYPVQGLRAVSVVGPQYLIAGSTSTIAMRKGNDSEAWLAEVGLPYRWFDEQSELFVKD